MKKVIIIIIAVLLLITTISVIGLNRIGDEIIDSMIDSELASIEQTELNTAVKQDNTDISDNSDNSDNSDINDNKQENKASPTDTLVNNNGETNAQNSDKVAAENSASSTGNEVKNKPKVITAQKVKEIKDQVTEIDKMTAATLVIKRLSSDDISTLKGLMNGGLTAEKKKEAVKIAYARFTPEEIVQIKELYHKYMK